jgi:inorganic pyrophosphatase
VLPGNVRYPADYCFVPSSTVSTDGEPLDVMVAAYDPVFPGCVIPTYVIDALEIATKEDTELNVFNSRYTH